MIISRTPMRISFMGGGTDLPAFYNEEEGMVLSTTINKYMYITVNDRFDETYRLSYSKTEICQSIDQIEHPIFQTVLKKYLKKGRGLELISMADIPSGTGLGSSSVFTVGLLHALKAHFGIFQSEEELAQEASRIEIEELREPIGKQDQYAAAYGGLRFYRFLPSGEVFVDPVICSEKKRVELESSVMLFYTGVKRSASDVLKEQSRNTTNKREELRAMTHLALRLKDILQKDLSLKEFGEILNEGWKLKKNLASQISNGKIDDWYQAGLESGAWGGKILGAGGGGFLMFLCPENKRDCVREALKDLRPIDTKFEKQGSKIIFVG